MKRSRLEKHRIAKEAIDRHLAENAQTWRQRPMMGNLDESGLSRVWSLTKDPFAIVTAFRGSNDRQTNLGLNRTLLASLNAARMGAHLLIGHYQETQDGYKIDLRGGQRVVTAPGGEVIPYEDAVERGLFRDGDGIEDSFFVPIPKSMDLETFRDKILEIITRYNQDSAIFSDGDSIVLMDQSGGSFRVGSKASFGRIGHAYSQLRNRPETPFIFEGTAEPISPAMGRALFRHAGLLHTTWITDRKE